ncbi:MAG: lipocalin family protein [Pseudomonadota bacterium]
MKKIKAALVSMQALLLSACAAHNPIPTPDYVDLDRFSGDWYVLASIPTIFEKDIVNATESYEKVADNKIATTFKYKKSFEDKEFKSMTPVGYVTDDPSNAIWKMQFIWPFKSDYRIAYVDDDYQSTIIARVKRDYVWILTRTPDVSEAEYQALSNRVKDLGYDLDKLTKVTHKWEESELLN